MIYLDNSATTKVREEVKAEMDKYHDEVYGNPNSFHSKGLQAKQAVDKARETIAKILNCGKDEIIFTGGGTESINLAIQGLAMKTGIGHIISSKIEHPAVLETCKYLESEGFEITYLDVDEKGLVKVEDVKNAIKENTILISIMYANNEIGTIQPIKEIGILAKENEIVFHTDACQAGILNLDVRELNVDLMTLNGSKIYGPKGIGMLFKRKGVQLKPIMFGGGQEDGLRSGTHNVPGIAGFAKALELIQKDKEEETKRLLELRTRLYKGLNKIKDVKINGDMIKRLPNNLNISFLNVEGESILLYLNEEGICASTGSACSSKKLEISHVLKAMGVEFEYAHGSIRFSLGRETSEKDIDKVIEVMPQIIKKLREISPLAEVQNE